MPYAILPDDPDVGAAVRRIAREEAEGAVAQARGDGPLPLRVHEMRKAVKKLRGLLRLVRPAMKAARAENDALRDAARALSALRDSAVLLATVEPLAEGLEGSRREALLAPFRADAAAHAGDAGGDRLPPFAAALEALRDRSEGWRIRGDGWSALEPGLLATWRAARAAMGEALRRDSPEAAHEWRKRVKDHWYQARLLTPIWPDLMKPHAGAADALGELLGQANDLAVLAGRLDALPLDPALRAEAAARADARRAGLRAEAEPLGRRLLADTPSALARRWGAWWRLRDAA